MMRRRVMRIMRKRMMIRMVRIMLMKRRIVMMIRMMRMKLMMIMMKDSAARRWERQLLQSTFMMSVY